MATGTIVNNLPAHSPRCANRDRKCPSAGHCRRHLDKPSYPIHYAAWEVRREAGADRCDGFIPINCQSISTTAQGGNP